MKNQLHMRKPLGFGRYIPLHLAIMGAPRIIDDINYGLSVTDNEIDLFEAYFSDLIPSLMADDKFE